MTIEKFAKILEWGERFTIFGTVVYQEFLAGKDQLTVEDMTTMKASKVQLVNPPLTVTAQQVASPEAAKAEQYESVLVKVAGARFQGAVNLDGSWPLKTTELNRIFVNKWMYTFLPAEGHFYTVTGIVNGLFNAKGEAVMRPFVGLVTVATSGTSAKREAKDPEAWLPALSVAVTRKV